MKTILSALISGLVFGIGLGLSGMTQADKVIGFLDVTDNWDPSLAFVMGGAIAVHFVLYRLILRQPSPLFGERFGIPTRTDLDARLIGGSALFGVGWALGGYCPGPGLVSAPAGSANALTFVAALTGGMLLFHIVDEAWSGHKTRTAERTKPVELDEPITINEPLGKPT